MIKLSECVANLADPDLDALVYGAARDIDTVAAVLDIDPHYLSVQVRIHLPRYSREQLLEGEGIDIIRDVLRRLRGSLEAFDAIHSRHRALNGIDEIPRGARVKSSRGELTLETDASETICAIERREVDPDLGLEVQREMHYIHAPREDTFLHAGIFLPDKELPLAYAAVSELERQYLLDALESSGVLSATTAPKVASLTRAFGYNPLPKNAMSMLFEWVAKELSAAGYTHVITALNPLLGFKGSIFSGSSFIPFAISPMEYWYNEDGSYMNRRSASEAIAQNLDTPPIIWLVRGLDSRRQRAIESFDGPLHVISQEAYRAR